MTEQILGNGPRIVHSNIQAVNEERLVPPSIPPIMQEEEEEPIQNVISPKYKDLRELLLTGQVEREIEIMGFLFRFRTLNQSEMTACLNAVSSLEDITKITQIRTETLARGILSVNDQPLEYLYQGDVNVPKLEKKKSVLNAMQQSFVQAIYTEYDGIMIESQKIVGNIKSDDIKN